MFSTKNDLTSHKYKLSFHKSSEFRNCTATGKYVVFAVLQENYKK